MYLSRHSSFTAAAFRWRHSSSSVKISLVPGMFQKRIFKILISSFAFSFWSLLLIVWIFCQLIASFNQKHLKRIVSTKPLHTRRSKRFPNFSSLFNLQFVKSFRWVVSYFTLISWLNVLLALILLTEYLYGGSNLTVGKLVETMIIAALDLTTFTRFSRHTESVSLTLQDVMYSKSLLKVRAFFTLL